MKNPQITWVELIKAFKNMRKLFIVFINKIAVYKAGRFVEQVTIGFDVELIALLKFISFLNFVFNHKRHVAERNRNELSEDKPIMVLSVYSMAFLVS